LDKRFDGAKFGAIEYSEKRFDRAKFGAIELKLLNIWRRDFSRAKFGAIELIRVEVIEYLEKGFFEGQFWSH
jgi:hypothetical protein